MSMVLAGSIPGSFSIEFPRLVVGIGYSSAATAAEIITLIEQSLACLGADQTSLAAIATHQRKAGDANLLATARHFDVPVCYFGDADLGLAVPNPSAKVVAAIGLTSVAEAAASAAGALILAKQKSAYVTCALSRCAPDFEPLAFGQPSTSASTAASMLATSSAGP
ncbi:cobalamin biosynthesis protein [Devosia sp. 2618]|uniref:cobalamin biosynthesis protein n=1 Tax=Devosia sp. 2618 TaxID=3156454 RepID=UPI00339B14AD